jgi:hypothetical protein
VHAYALAVRLDGAGRVSSLLDPIITSSKATLIHQHLACLNLAASEENSRPFRLGLRASQERESKGQGGQSSEEKWYRHGFIGMIGAGIGHVWCTPSYQS